MNRSIAGSRSMLRPMLWVMLICMAIAWDGGNRARAGEWQRVKKVFDGDTIVLEDGTRVRYLGINTPEVAHKDARAEYFGDKARRENAGIVRRKKVRLEFDREKKDRFGRTLAYVFLEDGRFVNQLLVEKGCAYVFYHSSNTRYWDTLFQAQKRAIHAGAGIWPFIKSIRGTFMGNKASRRFHHPTCRFAKKLHPKNKVSFSSLVDAFRAGFAPCRSCVDLHAEK